MLSLVIAAAITSVTVAPAPVHVCPAPPQTPVANTTPLHARKLADLPDANQVLLVMRQVNGCAYQQVVRFKVSTPGAAPLASSRGVLVPDGARVLPASPDR